MYVPNFYRYVVLGYEKRREL